MEPVRYPEDCIQIQVTANALGFDCTLKQAEELWEKHSEDYCAGWLDVQSSEEKEIEDAVREYFQGDR